MRVSFEDILYTENEIVSKVSDWTENSAEFLSYIDSYYSSSSIKGKAAEESKNYMKNTYSVIIGSFLTLLEDLKAKYKLYISSLLELDTDVLAILDTDTLDLCNESMGEFSQYVSDEEEKLQAELANISDLYTAPSTSYASVMELMEDTGENSSKISDAIIENEDLCKSYITSLEEFYDALSSFILECSGKTVSDIESYDVSKMLASDSYINLEDNWENSVSFQALNAEDVEKAKDTVDGANEELAHVKGIEAKEDAVLKHYANGTVYISSGVSAVIVTEGMAIPIVIFAAVAGGISVLLGGAEYYEGTDELINVINNDADSTAFNPVRDTLFSGYSDIKDRQAKYDELVNVIQLATAVASGAPGAIDDAAKYGITETGEYLFVASVGTVTVEVGKDKVINLVLSEEGYSEGEQAAMSALLNWSMELN